MFESLINENALKINNLFIKEINKKIQNANIWTEEPMQRQGQTILEREAISHIIKPHPAFRFPHSKLVVTLTGKWS